MMGHFCYVIVIAAVIWLITAALRRAKAKEKAVASNEGRPPRRRPSSTDIDRFLEEVKRRQSEQRRRQAEPQEVEPVVVIAPSPRPKPPPVRRPPQRRNYAEPVLVAEAVPVAMPVTASRRVSETPAIPAPEIAIANRPVHIEELLRLLHSPQGLRAAFLLNEILGPPQSKRGRKR